MTRLDLRDGVMALVGCLAISSCLAGCEGGTADSEGGLKPKARRFAYYEGVARDAWELAESVPEITQPTYYSSYSYGVCLTWYGELTDAAIETITSKLREEKAKSDRLRDVTLMLRFFKEEVLIDRGQGVTERGKEIEYRRVEIEQ